MSRWTKEQAGYVGFMDTQFECLDCAMFRKTQQACWQVKGTIREYGSCNYFYPGKPVELSGNPRLTQAEAGYAENPAKVGFSCKRCEEFSPEKQMCQKVAGSIDPDACCNRWEADPVRSKIPTMAFHILKAKKS